MVPIDVDFKPERKSPFRLCCGNRWLEYLHTDAKHKLTSVLWAMYFHHDRADAGRQSRGLLWGNDVCKRCVSDGGMLMRRPSRFPPWETNHWHSWIVLTLTWICHSRHPCRQAEFEKSLSWFPKTFCGRKYVFVYSVYYKLNGCKNVYKKQT